MPSLPEISKDKNETDPWILGLDWSKRDPRLDDFPLMSSLWPAMYVVTSYILASYLMIRRRDNDGENKPFFKRWFLVLYNVPTLAIYTRILGLSLLNYRGNSGT